MLEIEEKFCPGCGGKLSIVAYNHDQDNYLVEDKKLTCISSWTDEISVQFICKNMPNGELGTDPYPHLINPFDREWSEYASKIKEIIAKNQFVKKESKLGKKTTRYAT